MGRVSDAKDRLLDAAIELVWRNSYGAVSVEGATSEVEASTVISQAATLAIGQGGAAPGVPPASGVPEPATVLVVITGLAALGVWRRKRRS